MLSSLYQSVSMMLDEKNIGDIKHMTKVITIDRTLLRTALAAHLQKRGEALFAFTSRHGLNYATTRNLLNGISQSGRSDRMEAIANAIKTDGGKIDFVSSTVDDELILATIGTKPSDTRVDFIGRIIKGLTVPERKRLLNETIAGL